MRCCSLIEMIEKFLIFYFFLIRLASTSYLPISKHVCNNNKKKSEYYFFVVEEGGYIYIVIIGNAIRVMILGEHGTHTRNAWHWRRSQH